MPSVSSKSAAIAAPARIPPFGERLRAIAWYPFQGSALAMIVGIALLVGILGWMPITGRILTWICWLAALKFSFEILRATANGHLTPPDGFLRVENILVLKYLVLVYGTWGFLNLVYFHVSAQLATWVYYIFWYLTGAAAIMVLVMTGSLRAAFRPDRWLQLIHRIGWMSYLLVLGLLVVFHLNTRYAVSMLWAWLPSFIAWPLVMAVSLWLLFAMCHLMGYLIYQHHEALGFTPEAHENRLERPADRDQQLLDQAAALLNEGRPDDALQWLRGEMQQRAVSFGVHEFYRRLLTQAGDREALLAHGRVFLHLLLQEKSEYKRAMALVKQCLILDPNFTTPEVEDGVRLARQARGEGQIELALALLRAALKAKPKHRDAPAWAADAAEMLLRKPGHDATVRALLGAVLPRAEGETRVRIEQLLGTLRPESPPQPLSGSV